MKDHIEWKGIPKENFRTFSRIESVNLKKPNSSSKNDEKNPFTYTPEIRWYEEDRGNGISQK